MRKAVFIVLALALVIFTGYKIKGRIDQTKALTQQTRQQGNQPQANVTVVKVIPLVPQSIKETLRLAGEIKPEAEIVVQPRINGRLTALLVNEGQMVRADQLVATLDDETIRLQMQQSEASMTTVQTNLRQAELAASRAKADQERYQELLTKRYISQRDYDLIETTYLNAQASVEAYQAQLAAAQKNYEILQTQQGYTKIYSPAAGIVIGEAVTVGMNLTTGTTMMTIAPVNPIKLEFNVDQKDTARIRRGMQVRFSCDAFPDLVFTGAINQVAPTFNSKTRTLSLAARLNNPDNKLLPGIFGTAEIMIGGKDKALVVPQEAVVDQAGASGVFLVDRRKQAQFVRVVTGLSSEGQIEITSGLKPGDLVVVIGQNRLRDGQPVQLTGGDPSGRRPGGPNGGRTQASAKAGESR